VDKDDELTKESAMLLALNQISSLLLKLDHDARQRTIKAVTALFNLEAPSAPTALTVAPRIRDQIRPDTKTLNFSADRTLTPSAFLAEKRPETMAERVACLAYYYANYLTKKTFESDDIIQLNKQAGQEPFTRVKDAIYSCHKLGLISPAGKSSKQLTTLGEQYVLALPDREATKSLIKSKSTFNKKTNIGSSKYSKDMKG
jgi:hypothetical protein